MKSAKRTAKTKPLSAFKRAALSGSPVTRAVTAPAPKRSIQRGTMASIALSHTSSDIDSFREHLQQSTRILALLGAGLSASSGLPTFRGAGGIWRNQDATDIATPEAFEIDPGLVWQFYSYRRHMALAAQPNKAHYALAELARRKAGFLTLSQNVDGLSQRAGHPADKLHLLHGNLFDVKCAGHQCDYSEINNYTDPIVPALAIPTQGPQPEPSSSGDSGEATKNLMNAIRFGRDERCGEADISNADVPIPRLSRDDLPRCPKCSSNILRPGVVWFGEALPGDVIRSVESWIDEGKVDLMLVVGTSAQVFPAAGYVEHARDKGARVAIINLDRGSLVSEGGSLDLGSKDWLFEGDAAMVVPEILKDVIGEV